MDSIARVFGTILKWFYDISGHYGMAIILFTIFTKIILMPLTVMQQKSSAKINKVQPLMKIVQNKYKDDPQVQGQKMQEVYKKYEINPMAGCLPLLIQLPIIVALFRAMRMPETYVFGSADAYALADTGFLWIKSLSKPDVINLGKFKIPFILPVFTAIFQYLQTRLTFKEQGGNAKGQAASMQKSMMYVFPILMLFWGVSFPSGLMLYWSVGTVVQIITQKLIEKFMKVPNAEEFEEELRQDIENEIKSDSKRKKKNKKTLSEKNKEFYDGYTKTKGTIVKKVRKIPKKSIKDNDEGNS